MNIDSTSFLGGMSLISCSVLGYSVVFNNVHGTIINSAKGDLFIDCDGNHFDLQTAQATFDAFKAMGFTVTYDSSTGAYKVTDGHDTLTLCKNLTTCSRNGYPNEVIGVQNQSQTHIVDFEIKTPQGSKHHQASKVDMGAYFVTYISALHQAFGPRVAPVKVTG